MCIACPPLGNYQQFSLQCKQSLIGIWSWRITGDKSTQPMQWLFPWGSDRGVQKKRQKKGASMGFLLPPRARLFLALSKAPVPLQPFNVILKIGPGKNLAFQGIHSIWFLILVQKKLSFSREPFNVILKNGPEKVELCKGSIWKKTIDSRARKYVLYWRIPVIRFELFSSLLSELILLVKT